MVNVVEKIVTVPMKVEDLSGLYLDLKRGDFAVRNVGADERGTYIYLDLEEEKDPVPIAESWIGRSAPSPSDPAVFKARMEEFQAVLNPPAAPVIVDQGPAASLEAPAAASPAAEGQTPKRFAFIRRILGMK